MKNRKPQTAAAIPCELIMHPTEARYVDEHQRLFQGCPTIAITRGGRIYLGWYSGGDREPHMDNFNLLVRSDDLGKTWSRPLLVIPSDRQRWVQALDIQLWTAPDGRLFVFWVQNNTHPAEPGYTGWAVDGFVFDDWTHAEWVSVCDDPDADEPVFSAPRYLDKGFLRCKPLALDNGAYMNFNYDQASDRYGYSLSFDQGRTYRHAYGAVKLPTPFDEAMAYQKRDGSVRLFARTSVGEIAESTSFDRGETWTEAKKTGLPNANTRLFVARTPSGRILLVNNDDSRSRRNMTVYLSDDDGATWPHRRLIDGRDDLSYPDADFYQDRIYLTYDRERCGAREILFTSFTEEDILHPDRPIDLQIVSKP